MNDRFIGPPREGDNNDPSFIYRQGGDPDGSDLPEENSYIEIELPSGRIIDPNDPDECDRELTEADFPGPPKIRVFDSDGVFRGGLWKQRICPGDRNWLAPPAKDHGEKLYVSADGMCLRVFTSKNPKLTGSAECDDLFDADSYAVRCTATEAASWLREHGYSVPDDLAAVGDVDWTGYDSPSEWADHFHCSLDTLHKRIRERGIMVGKPTLNSRRWRFRKSDLPKLRDDGANKTA